MTSEQYLFWDQLWETTNQVWEKIQVTADQSVSRLEIGSSIPKTCFRQHHQLGELALVGLGWVKADSPFFVCTLYTASNDFKAVFVVADSPVASELYFLNVLWTYFWQPFDSFPKPCSVQVALKSAWSAGTVAVIFRNIFAEFRWWKWRYGRVC